MSQIRYDLFHDRYVIIAPNRAQRAGFLKPQKLVEPEKCPFCEGNEKLTPPEIFALRDGSGANEPGWRTRVVPNLFKAVEIEASLTQERRGSFEWQDGFGAHEVIIDMPDHETGVERWPARALSDWLATVQERVTDLHRDFRLVWLSVFKNHGVHAGATQPHPHTQIIGLPMIPKRELPMLAHQVTYFREHGRPVAETLREEELHSGERIVLKNEHFVAIAPFASAMPFEMWITPLAPLATMITMNSEEREALADLMQKLYARMVAVLGPFDFNLTFEIAPLQKDGTSASMFGDFAQACRFGIRILPRITGIGGFELSSGMHINPVAPETAARKIRNAKL